MSKIKVTEVHALPNDVLRVTGTLGDDTLIAYGWQSALTNHYPPEAYDADGNLKLVRHKHAPRTPYAPSAFGDPEHEPREMTKAEKLDYCRSLLEAVVESRPQPIEF